MRNNKKGFTITEIMVVIVIMGILGGIAIPSFRNYIVRMRLRSARDDILSTLRVAKARAMSERVVYRVIFDTTGYAVGIDPDGDGTFSYDEARVLPQGVSIVSIDTYFEFRPDRTGILSDSNVVVTNGKNNVKFYLTFATSNIKVVTL